MARARVLAGAGLLAFHQGDLETARTRLDEAVAVSRALGDEAGTAYGLHFREMAVLYLGASAASSSLAESVALFRAAGDAWGLAVGLCSMGIDAIQRGDPAAGPLLAESLALAREQGEAWALARALHYSGEAARLEADYDRAASLYEESLSLYRALGHGDGTAHVLHNLGHVALHQGDPRRAAVRFSEALAGFQEPGIGRHLAYCLMGLAEATRVLAQPEQAARLVGTAARLNDEAATAVWPVDRVAWEHTVAALRTRLGDVRFAAARDAGRGQPLAGALAEAAAALMTPSSEAAAVGASGPAMAARLTPREREVLELLVSGRTNAEIAAALVVGRRTVTTHVEHIFDKLEVHTRTEAAARARELAIV